MSLNVSTSTPSQPSTIPLSLTPKVVLRSHHSEPAKRWQTNKAQILCSHFLQCLSI